ncbi:MAG TPA: ABC transporter substrate-binding protein [Actinomycetaceae bacterium]|nr:ABC transporter substrate-binding protein [Actinomycetaceae bacterium]
MKSIRIATLAAAAAAASLVLAACDSAEGDNDAGENAGGESVSIGITQIIDHPSLNAAADGFKEALADAGFDVEYDEQNAQGDQSVAASIAGRLADADLDMILAIATPTAQAASQAITDIPVLFTAVTDPVSAGLVDSNDAPGANVTGTSDRNPVAEQLQLILDLAPDTETVGIVYSSAEPNSEIQVEWAEEAAAELGLTIEKVTVSTSSEVQQASESLDVDAYYVPTDNTVVSALETLLGVAEDRQVPVVVGEGDSVVRGGVATYGISYFDLGYQTGEMAVRILNGEAEPATMPVETQDELLVYLNLGAADRMGVEIPQELIDRALPENITE